jgi:hypothetical protein
MLEKEELSIEEVLGLLTVKINPQPVTSSTLTQRLQELHEPVVGRPPLA